MTHEKEIEIRWRDLDAFGHVNHIVFLTYLEEVRDEWLGRVLADPALVWGYVIARVEIDYRRELTLEDDVIVARCSLERLGTKSAVTSESIATRGGETAAEAKAVLVARDAETGRLPRHLRRRARCLRALGSRGVEPALRAPPLETLTDRLVPPGHKGGPAAAELGIIQNMSNISVWRLLCRLRLSRIVPTSRFAA